MRVAMTPRLARRQGGVVLAVCLVFLTLLTIIGIGAMRDNRIQERLSGNARGGFEAFSNAETGLKRTLAFISASGGGANLDQYLGTTVLTSGGNGDDALGMTYTVTGLDNEFLDNGDPNPAENGNPNTDADGVIIVRATGTRGSASSSVEAYITRAYFQTRQGILTAGNLELTKNAAFTGTMNDIHSNGDITALGTVSARNVTASGTADVADQSSVDLVDSNVDAEYIPSVDLAIFMVDVTYILTSEGKVTDGTGAVIDSSGWNGWVYDADAGRWNLESGQPTPPNGTYYVEGDAQISNSAGQSGAWEVTLVAEGSIVVSGDPLMVPDHSSDAANAILMVAGTDINIHGLASQSYTGVIVAGEQVAVSGSPNFYGAIVAAGTASADPEVESNKIAGNAQFHNDGSPTPFVTDRVTTVSWLGSY